MPLQAGLQRLTVCNPAARGLPRTYVLFTGKQATDLIGPVMARMAKRARRAGWDTRALPIAHGRSDGAEAVAQLLADLS